MKCSSCGVENAAAREFCVECGSCLALSCAASGTPHAAGEKFYAKMGVDAQAERLAKELGP